jgi:hypothetical protein
VRTSVSCTASSGSVGASLGDVAVSVGDSLAGSGEPLGPVAVGSALGVSVPGPIVGSESLAVGAALQPARRSTATSVVARIARIARVGRRFMAAPYGRDVSIV